MAIAMLFFSSQTYAGTPNPSSYYSHPQFGLSCEARCSQTKPKTCVLSAKRPASLPRDVWKNWPNNSGHVWTKVDGITCVCTPKKADGGCGTSRAGRILKLRYYAAICGNGRKPNSNGHCEVPLSPWVHNRALCGNSFQSVNPDEVEVIAQNSDDSGPIYLGVPVPAPDNCGSYSMGCWKLPKPEPYDIGREVYHDIRMLFPETNLVVRQVRHHALGVSVVDPNTETCDPVPTISHPVYDIPTAEFCRRKENGWLSCDTADDYGPDGVQWKADGLAPLGSEVYIRENMPFGTDL